MGIKRGIIQSRGLGDIIIALPIARHYYDQGDEIVWPICAEFYASVKDTAPWVNWVSIETDPQGDFFLKTPLSIFAKWGVDPDEALYLYQYLNSNPELTDPEQFNILKFDQYKYAVAGVPFIKKWDLGRCVARSNEREMALKDQLSKAYDLQQPFCVAHLTGSNARVDTDIVRAFIDPAVGIINVDLHLTDCVFDWIGILERAHSIVCLDSVFANMVDQLAINKPALYWIRRSSWDLTPVQGQSWTIVPTNLPIAEPTRVDPAKAAAAKLPPADQGSSGLTSHVPFQTDRSKVPKSFMSALRK